MKIFYSFILVLSIFLLIAINQINSLQCYKCGCFVIPGETTCTDESQFQCLIQYVEESYCVITRTAGDIEFGHNPNSVLIYMESLHYIRAKERIIYSESSLSWTTPTVVEVAYGCDWNLCNSPRILNLLPTRLTYTVDSNLLTDTLIANPPESSLTCLSCFKCINSTEDLNCTSEACDGTCLIDDHLNDPQFNTESCLIAFESQCVPVKLNTSVEIIGTFYIDDKLFEINEINFYCQKSDCNNPTTGQLIKDNTTYSTQLNDQLYFRPDTSNTTPAPNDGLFACYQCHCEKEIGSTDCSVLECTIEYRNRSYCEIVRDFKSFPGFEHITLGHVQKDAVPYKHYIHAEEELILYKNLTWIPSSVNMISYICDWELCNDGRIVDKLTTSFQFNALPSEIAQYLQGSQSLASCLECTVCTNSSLDFSNCSSVSCSPTGYCLIDQYIDDPQYDDCEYAFEASCIESATESSIIITATYNIDDGTLEFDEVDVYCSVDNCNQPSTIDALLKLISEDIRLDQLFIFRPVENTTVSPNITEPTPSSTTSSQTTSSTSTSTVSVSSTTSQTTTTLLSSSTQNTTITSSIFTTTQTTTGSSTSTTTTNPNAATNLNYSFFFFILFLINSLFIKCYH